MDHETNRRSTDPVISREEMRLMMSEVAKEAAIAAVKETFLRMGLQSDDPLEAQKDFQHLRSWRQNTQSLGMKVLAAAIGLLVTGSLAALWIGIKANIRV